MASADVSVAADNCVVIGSPTPTLRGIREPGAMMGFSRQSSVFDEEAKHQRGIVDLGNRYRSEPAPRPLDDNGPFDALVAVPRCGTASRSLSPLSLNPSSLSPSKPNSSPRASVANVSPGNLERRSDKPIWLHNTGFAWTGRTMLRLEDEGSVDDAPELTLKAPLARLSCVHPSPSNATSPRLRANTPKPRASPTLGHGRLPEPPSAFPLHFT